MKVEYSSNNSGGGWWLKDEDWKALEAAGWKVEWGRMYFCPKEGEKDHSWNQRPRYPFECVKVLSEYDKLHNTPPSCQGHQGFLRSEDMGEGDRWLGALATKATLECETPAEAMRSFEKATGQDVTDEGCSCCGSPHSFSWGSGKDWGHASGEDALTHLHPGKKIPKNLRAAMEDES